METKEVRPKFNKGFWRPEEDVILKKYVETHGEGNWTLVSKKSGLLRGAKSCRLRWKNYLRPNLKRGTMSEDEKDLIIRLHKLLGNRWSLIAGRLPGRTDNEVKNYWNTHLNKKRPTHGRHRITSHHPSNDSPLDNKRDLSSMDASTDLARDENEARPEIIGEEGDNHMLHSWVDVEIENGGRGTNMPFEPMFFIGSPVLDEFLFGEPFGVGGLVLQ